MPAKKRTTKAERELALKSLRESLPRGSTVYTVVRSVSRSQQVRNISMISMANKREMPINLSHFIAVVMGYSMSTKRGSQSLRIAGRGVHLTQHLVMLLSATLYDDATALNHYAI